MMNFFSTENNQTSGPATPYSILRSRDDLHDLIKNEKLKELDQAGIRRAIKFSARRDMSDTGMSKAQRCTPAVVVAFQAAILAEIVITLSKQESKEIKKQTFDTYADNYFEKNWRETDIGKRLSKAVESNNYQAVFPLALNIDQRYIWPKDFYQRLTQDDSFKLAGRFSLHENHVLTIDSQGEQHEKIISPTISLKK